MNHDAKTRIMEPVGFGLPYILQADEMTEATSFSCYFQIALKFQTSGTFLHTR